MKQRPGLEPGLFIWGAITVALLVVLALALRIPTNVEHETQPFEDHQIEFVTDRTPIEQTFVATSDGLDGVDVRFRRVPHPDDARVRFRLYDARSGAELATRQVLTSELTQSGFLSFRFPPIPGSRAGDYRFTLEIADSPGQMAPSVSATSWDVYPPGSLTTGNERQPGDLTFRTHYQTPLLVAYLDQIVDAKPGLFGATMTYSVLGAVYAGTVMLLLGAVTRVMR